MCGIFGFTSCSGRSDVRVLAEMSRLLAHRGPDHYGSWIGERISLGMNRLSIIDLQHGFQPIWNETKSVAVMMNGEIYNYRELRRLLREKGHRFSTESDTEVLVHLYEEEGALFVGRLAGMFAYAIWDSLKQRLYVGRDRLGIKPLYYALDSGSLAFASEAKALMAWPGFRDEIDSSAIGLFLGLFYLPEPCSIWRQVRKLEPGHFLDWHDGELSNVEYWSMREVLSHPTFSDEYRLGSSYHDELRTLLSGIVKDHLVSDVPIAVLLSAGLDSSIVALLGSKQDPELSAFTVGSAGEDDESEAAQATARLLGVPHRTVSAETNLLVNLPKLLWHFDEPFGDSSMFPTYEISEKISRTHRVALSGDGGDEVFGGYNYYRMLPAISRVSNMPRPLLSVAGAIARRLPMSVAEGLARYLGISGSASAKRSARFIRNPKYWSPWGAYRYSKEWISPGVLGELAPAVATDVSASLNQRLKDLSVDPSVDPTRAFSSVDLSFGLPGDMLTKVDRMSMASSIEVRVPFCDHRLIEWFVRVPRGVREEGMVGKRFVREAFKDSLPEHVLHGTKRGFGIPLGEWLEHDKQTVSRIVLSHDSWIGNWANVRALSRFLSNDLRSDIDSMYAVWAFLVLEVWARIYLTNKGEKPSWTLAELASGL